MGRSGSTNAVEVPAGVRPGDTPNQ